jgi:hypothetical protein
MNNLSNTFNVAPSSASEIIDRDGSVIAPNEGSATENADADYCKARSNLYNLLSQGQEALQAALEVAKQSEHPRAFEVVGGLVKQLADVNHQLLDLSEKRNKLSQPSKVSSNVTNNTLFVGSTAELGKMIKSMMHGE